MGPVVNSSRPKRRRDESGMTLVELGFVILISAILAAVAVPTFFGQRKHAAGSLTISRLDAVAGSLGEVWAQYRSFPSASSLAADISGSDPNLPAIAGSQTSGVTPPAPVVVSSTSTYVVAGAESGGLTCLYVAYDETASKPGPGTWYGKSPANNGACVVSTGYTPTSGWQRSWSAMGI